MKRAFFIAGLLLLWAAAPALATPYFSAQTGQGCTYCHELPQGGRSLTKAGHDFRAAGFILDPKHRPPAWRKALFFVAGFVHILSAVLWFGTIFYIHIFIRARSFVGGLPKQERVLGQVCTIAVGLSGAVLTWLRVPELKVLWTTTFGLVLLVKMACFLAMLLIAGVVTTWLNRKMAQATAGSQAQQALPDGRDGRPAHIAVAGQIYDVSASKLWKDGKHMGRHQAGGDLSEDLEGAPHGPEVLQRLPSLGPAPLDDHRQLALAARIYLALSYTVLGLMLLVLLCLAWWSWGPPLAQAAPPFERAKAQACLGCHRQKTPGIFAGWAASAHAKAKVSCLHCHQVGWPAAQAASDHSRHYDNSGPWAQSSEQASVAAVVTPRDCGRCHLNETRQFARSKHAGTLAIAWQGDPWLVLGMANRIERASGCAKCHGSVLAAGWGGLSPRTWPNVGVGRVNLDGSKGSCTACHTRHAFSVAEARKPEACGQCHLGPAHPQMEIFRESKHGAIYEAHGRAWRWDVASAGWRPGQDYHAPTCAVCHMAAIAGLPASHDVGSRLAWELQAPLSVRPPDFPPAPSPHPWPKARAAMKRVCTPCHGRTWIDGHFDQLDRAVRLYNREYYLPARQKLEKLYSLKLLDPQDGPRSPLWIQFYELWHYEGRRARMGAAMMAPDYAWWHGFYELKKRYASFMQHANKLIKENKKGYVAPVWPGGGGREKK